MSRLHLVPSLSLREANALVAGWHRHHQPVKGCKFVVGVADADDELHGAAIVGRPRARLLQDGWTAEVVRLVTDGTPNACSMLYAACWRAWRALGGRRIVTYILESEPGTSLRAAGWDRERETENEPHGWDRAGRRRLEGLPKHEVGDGQLPLLDDFEAVPQGPKVRWAAATAEYRRRPAEVAA